MIAGEIRRYLRDNSALRVSRSMRDTAYRALQARRAAHERDGPQPDARRDSRGHRRQGGEDVVFALDAITEPVSLSEPVYADSGESVSVMDQIRDNSEGRPRAGLSAWPSPTPSPPWARGRSASSPCAITTAKTQMEVAREIHISQAQVSRLEKNALTRIKKSMFAQ